MSPFQLKQIKWQKGNDIKNIEKDKVKISGTKIRTWRKKYGRKDKDADEDIMIKYKMEDTKDKNNDIEDKMKTSSKKMRK